MTRIPVPATISVTEKYSFRECRRQWYLGNVRRLEPVITPMRYWFGTGLHAALQAYHTSPEPLAGALAAYDKWYNKAESQVAEAFGFLWEGAKQEYFDAYALTREMLTNYDEFHRSQNDKWEPVAVEQRVWVPILHPNSRRALIGRPRLTARFDFVGSRPPDHRRGLRRGTVLVDHKSAAQRPSLGRELDLDDQLTGYAYVYWRMTGELPEELIYNVLIKAVPKPPEMLKNGTPSKAKGQSTTFGLYLETIRGLGLDASEYAEVLGALQSEGWSRYFVREGVTRNLAQLEAYEEHTYHEYLDMAAVAKDPAKAYPSPSPMRCGGCPFVSVCMAMEDGSDYESLIAAKFKVNNEERW